MFQQPEAEQIISDARRALRHSDRVNADFRRRIARLKEIERLSARAMDGSELHFLANHILRS